LVNKETTILQFRLEVVDALVKSGYEVIVSTPNTNNRISEIEAVGANVIITHMEKDSTDPVKDIILLNTYRKLIKKTCADIVLTYTIKPNVYGGMAAASLGVPYVANITGLGTALENHSVLQKIAIVLYKIGFRKISKVFFQNTENRQFFLDKKIAVDKHELLPGSGVNLKKFVLMEYPESNTIEFAFVSRIREEKGIEQYIEMARCIKEKYPNTHFHVCGYGSQEYEERMKQLHKEGLIIYHGYLTDVREVLKSVHCVIHPTYYPEGMSNVLLESSACGRAIISTDRAGCKEAIENGINGYLIREKDTMDLIEKVECFINLSYEQKREMGLKGRAKVEREFDRNIVVERYLETVKKLIEE